MQSIGVGVFVITLDQGTPKFLVGLRSKTNKRGPGVWALPGGMVDGNESLAACSVREVKEETGLDVETETSGELMACVIGVSHHVPRENHITAWTVAYCGDDTTATVMEPHKCEEWRWVTADEYLALTPQEGEQVYWAPHDTLRILLPRIGFPIS